MRGMMEGGRRTNCFLPLHLRPLNVWVVNDTFAACPHFHSDFPSRLPESTAVNPSRPRLITETRGGVEGDRLANCVKVGKMGQTKIHQRPPCSSPLSNPSNFRTLSSSQDPFAQKEECKVENALNGKGGQVLVHFRL